MWLGGAAGAGMGPARWPVSFKNHLMPPAPSRPWMWNGCSLEPKHCANKVNPALMQP